MYYATAKRIADNTDFFNAFYSKRYQAVALLGAVAEAPYVAMWQQLLKVNGAVQSLLRQQPEPVNQASVDHRQAMERLIWEGLAEAEGVVDTVTAAIGQAVTDAEAIFRPVIQPPPD